jgi:hypothetical protein
MGDGPAWMLQSRAVWLDEAFAGRPVVNLLPGFDTYWLGYRGRDLALDPTGARRVFPGGGLLRPALLVDGRAAGTWSIKRHRTHVEVIVEPFEELTSDIQPGLDLEVEDLAHFLGREARLSVISQK